MRNSCATDARELAEKLIIADGRQLEMERRDPLELSRSADIS